MIETIWKQKSNTKKCKKCGLLFSEVTGGRDDHLFGRAGNELCSKCCRRSIQIRSKKDIYKGWEKAAPVLYKGHFKGGIDVTDLSGNKYKCYASNGF